MTRRVQMNTNTFDKINIRHLLRAKPKDWKINPEHNKYIMGFYHAVTNNYEPHNAHQMTLFHETKSGEIILTEIIDIDPETICTCSGFKDRHDTYIWENDIIRTNSGMTGSVVFEDGIYYVKFDENNKITIDNLIYNLKDVFEVITETYTDEVYELCNDIATIINDENTDAAQKITAVKEKLNVKNTNDECVNNHTKPDFSDMPCKIGDKVCFMNKDFFSQKIDLEKIMSIRYFAQYSQRGTVTHFYIDENGEKQILIITDYIIDNLTRGKGIIICTPEEFKAQAFENHRDVINCVLKNLYK